MAETCRKCKWSRVSLGDPTVGVCLYGSKEIDEKEAAGGTAQRALKGRAIKLSDPACEHFEPKGSRKEMLKEGF